MQLLITLVLNPYVIKLYSVLKVASDVLLTLVYIYILLIYDYFNENIKGLKTLQAEVVDEYNSYGTNIIYFLLVFHAIHLFKFIIIMVVIVYKTINKRRALKRFEAESKKDINQLIQESFN